MNQISTHVLDTTRGRPAAGVTVVLEHREGNIWRRLGSSQTDPDGRVRSLAGADPALMPGTYRLVFDTHSYFEALDVPTFYPEIVIVFELEASEAHYHVPLLLGPFGYTTYRGS